MDEVSRLFLFFFLHVRLCCLNNNCKQASLHIGRIFFSVYLFFTSLIVSGPKRIVFIALASVCIMSPARLRCECVGQPAFLSGLRKNCAASDIWHFSAAGITMPFENYISDAGFGSFFVFRGLQELKLATVWRIGTCGTKTNLVA